MAGLSTRTTTHHPPEDRGEKGSSPTGRLGRWSNPVNQYHHHLEGTEQRRRTGALSQHHRNEGEIMATTGEEAVTLEEFRQMTERAGLGMTAEEVADLKPLYELYAQYLKLLHTIDFQAEEIDVTFHPDWSPE
jgi:hypothetical protein